MSSRFDQAGYDLRCEWGLAGVQALAPVCDVLVIVDVLSFSTAVDIAVARGAAVIPYPWKDESAREVAKAKGALLAAGRSTPGAYSLSPASLLAIPAGTALLLPSPNGSTLSLGGGGTPTYTACFRNAPAVARRVSQSATRIAVIPAGEQWSDGSLRPCLEDLAGAGAVLAELRGTLSPEAEVAVAAFERVRHRLQDAMAQCGSGRELIERGFGRDVELASEHAVSSAAPVLTGDRFVES